MYCLRHNDADETNIFFQGALLNWGSNQVKNSRAGLAPDLGGSYYIAFM